MSWMDTSPSSVLLRARVLPIPKRYMRHATTNAILDIEAQCNNGSVLVVIEHCGSVTHHVSNGNGERAALGKGANGRHDPQFDGRLR